MVVPNFDDNNNQTLFNYFDDDYSNRSEYLKENLSCSNFGINNGGFLVTDNHSIIHYASNFYPITLAVPLYGYAMPILFIVTSLTNILVVAVLKQPHMRTSTNIILLAISLADLFTIVVPEFMFFYMFTLGHYVHPIYPLPICYLWTILTDIFPNLFHTSSIWLTLILAVQRYIFVCHGYIAKVWCNNRNAYKAIAWIFLIASIHQITRIFEYRFDIACVFENDDIYPVCVETRANWVRGIENTYYGIYFWFRVFFVHLGPCLILVVLNSLLFMALFRAQKTRKRLISDSKSDKKRMDADRTTMMLIVVVSVFLITEIPLAVISLLHILQSFRIFDIFRQEDYDKVKNFFILSNSFIIFMYPVNFGIYCGMSRHFREAFKNLFFRKNSRLCSVDSSRYSTVNGYKSCTNETIL